MAEENTPSESKLSTPPPEKKVSLSQALADANSTPSSPLGKVLAAKKEQENSSIPTSEIPQQKNIFPFLVGGALFLLLAFVVYGYTLFSKGIFHTIVDNPSFENISYILDGKEYFLAPKETKKIYSLTLKDGENEEKITFQKPWNKQQDLLNPTNTPYVIQYVLIGDEEYAHLLTQGSISIYDDHFQKTDIERNGNFTEIREYYTTGDWEYHIDELIPAQKTPKGEYEIVQKLTRYIDWYAEEDIYSQEELQENDEKKEDISEDTPSSTKKSWITSEKTPEVTDPSEVNQWDKKLDDDNWFLEIEEEYEKNIQETIKNREIFEEDEEEYGDFEYEYDEYDEEEDDDDEEIDWSDL